MSMTNPCPDGDPMPEASTAADQAVPSHAGGIPLPEPDGAGQPLPGSLEEFLLDRFSTTLEDPRTGLRIR